MNISEIISNDLKFFAHYSKVFTVSNIADYVDLDVESKFIQDILQRDARFFNLGLDSEQNAHFISNNVLIDWLIYLSVKLAKVNKSFISSRQFLNLSSSLGLTSKEAAKFTPVIVDFGRNWGLIGKAHKQSQFFLPIAHLASFVHRAHFASIVESYPSRAIFKLIRSLIDQKSTTTEESMMECVESVLSQLDPTEAYILTLRTGLAGTHMKLEEIAKEFGRTRERIRQIEVSARRRRVLVRPLLTMMIGDVIARKGSLVYQESSKTKIVIFIAKCLDIPYVKLPEIGMVILGTLRQQLEGGKSCTKAKGRKSAMRFILPECDIPLLKADVKTLSHKFAEYRESHLNLTQRVYSALKIIGRPAHFSLITSVHNRLFPNKPIADGTVTNALKQKEDVIVWVGSKGMYALKEWGYERPSQSLHDTVAEIVEKLYEKTGKPVGIQLIVGELGKYRRVINPASGLMAVSLNPKLMRVSPGHYIPARFGHERDREAAENDQLDRILEEYELQYSAADGSKEIKDMDEEAETKAMEKWLRMADSIPSPKKSTLFEMDTENKSGKSEFHTLEDLENSDSIKEEVRERKETIAISAHDIQEAILTVLNKRPNNSIALKALTKEVCKELSIYTRGNPRREFDKRIRRGVGVLKRKNRVDEYKAKNVRIRLI